MMAKTAPLTKEDLRKELESFTKDVLQQELKVLEDHLLSEIRSGFNTREPTRDPLVIQEESTTACTEQAPLLQNGHSHSDAATKPKLVGSLSQRFKSGYHGLGFQPFSEGGQHTVMGNGPAEALIHIDNHGADSTTSDHRQARKARARRTIRVHGLLPGLTPSLIDAPEEEPEDEGIKDIRSLVQYTEESDSYVAVLPGLCELLSVSCRRVVRHPQFVNMQAVVIFSNVLFVGAGIDYEARHWKGDERVTDPMKYVDTGFFIFFLVELILRIAGDKLAFFVGCANLFDMFLVLCQAFDVLSEWHVMDAVAGTQGLNVLRVLRVLRMGRVLRLLKVFHLFDELSNLIESISKSLRSLFWVLIIVTFMTYAFGVVLTHLVAEFRAAAGVDALDDETNFKLDLYYGTVTRSMLVLYEVMSQGVAWANIMKPLTTHISPYIAFLFIAYTAFVTFAMMNVVTSFFVDNTIRSVEESRNMKMAMALWGIFQGEDGTPLTGITPEQFYSYTEKPEMITFLNSLDLNPEECKDFGFFELLDSDGSGEVDAEELVRGCLKLRGSAKAVDLASMARIVRETMPEIKTQLSNLEEAFWRLEAARGVDTAPPPADL
eukprot:TRINITY_DN80191_c0_g1_i1.p1 TRINITY_DN80191_c0_g1~~TRINITY_DN80191_c0_g1_i1.p1  ORF type:complete len:604 (+),score=116.78 TRINITY_DN80191_c0_g1_i1:115-1926(+)